MVVAALAAAASPAGACATCYGAADSAMTQGMNNGILTLLGVIGVVQVGFVAMFVSIRRRSRRLQERREQFHLIRGGGS
jgi:hypothetical protein